MTGFVYRSGDDDPPISRKASAQPGVRMGQDDVDPARPLASIIVSADAAEPGTIRRGSVAAESQRAPLSGVRPVRKRTLYFSQELSNPSDPASTMLFFITEEGHAPAVLKISFSFDSGGRFDLFGGGVDLLINAFGDQVYSGPLSAPTMLTSGFGTFEDFGSDPTGCTSNPGTPSRPRRRRRCQNLSTFSLWAIGLAIGLALTFVRSGKIGLAPSTH